MELYGWPGSRCDIGELPGQLIAHVATRDAVSRPAVFYRTNSADKTVCAQDQPKRQDRDNHFSDRAD